MIIGKDTQGVTQISLKALEKLQFDGEMLEEVKIFSGSTIDTTCTFEFESGKSYEASGFSIGYGGEGPHGLWTAIRMFHPRGIPTSFWATPISKLDEGQWRWTLQNGFRRPWTKIKK